MCNICWLECVYPQKLPYRRLCWEGRGKGIAAQAALSRVSRWANHMCNFLCLEFFASFFRLWGFPYPKNLGLLRLFLGDNLER